MAESSIPPAFLENFEAAIEPIVADIDALYVLLSAFLVFFMQAGFCMLAAGSIRAKNARGIILKNLVDACLAAVVYYTIGWGVAGLLQENGNPFIGTIQYGLNGLDASSLYSWLFQFAFAATAATIVSGAMAERATFYAYMIYAVCLVGFIYPVVTHWVWSYSGWASAFRSDGPLLLGRGAYDFAGSGAVHLTGGLAACVGAWVLGPRKGRYDANGKVVEMPGHSAALATLGVFILWFGWYGFNPGSALLIVNTSELVARCAVTTTLAGAMGGLTVLITNMILKYIFQKEVVFDLMLAGNGALGGLVSITAGCAVVPIWSAIIIGMVGGWVTMAGSYLNAHVFKIDDPVDAVAVHMWAGTWAVFAVGLFATEEFVGQTYGEGRGYGGFFGGGGKLLGAQIIYLLAIYGWVGGTCLIMFGAMKFAGILRVAEDLEDEGADASHYGGHAYVGIAAPTSGKGEVFTNGKDNYAEVSALRAEVARLTSTVQSLVPAGKGADAV